jgi:hypothetical protein
MVSLLLAVISTGTSVTQPGRKCSEKSPPQRPEVATTASISPDRAPNYSGSVMSWVAPSVEPTGTKSRKRCSRAGQRCTAESTRELASKTMATLLPFHAQRAFLFRGRKRRSREPGLEPSAGRTRASRHAFESDGAAPNANREPLPSHVETHPGRTWRVLGSRRGGWSPSGGTGWPSLLVGLVEGGQLRRTRASPQR